EPEGPRRRLRVLVRGARVRGALGDADLEGGAPVPPGRLPAGGHGQVRARVGRRHGDPRRVLAAGGARLGGRGLHRPHRHRDAVGAAVRGSARDQGPHGPDLLDLAFGRDERAVEPFTPPKSMGAETTFERDCREPARLEETLRYQAERVARELRAEGLAACRVTLKLRWADFRTLTR